MNCPVENNVIEIENEKSELKSKSKCYRPVDEENK